LSFHATGEFCKLRLRLALDFRRFEAFLASVKTRFKRLLCYKLEWRNRCASVLDHPIFNNYFRYRSATRVYWIQDTREYLVSTKCSYSHSPDREQLKAGSTAVDLANS